MPKFFVSDVIKDGEINIQILSEDSRHIRDVLRMKIGEGITVCDSSGTDHECVIETFENDFVVVKIILSKESDNESPFEIIVYQGLPKSDKMESIIQKCVELGGARIVPVACARSIVKLTDKKDTDKKIARWNKIAYEAAKQCNRSIIPQIGQPISFKEAIHQISNVQISFIPWECEEKDGLKVILKNAVSLFNQNRLMNSKDAVSTAITDTDIMTDYASKVSIDAFNNPDNNTDNGTDNRTDNRTGNNTGNNTDNTTITNSINYDTNIISSNESKNTENNNIKKVDNVAEINSNILIANKKSKPQIAFIVGPEGGFDQTEIQLAKQIGIPTVTLGKRILRTETVAPAILAMLMYEMELQ